jgi:hypothetical protein
MKKVMLSFLVFFSLYGCKEEVISECLASKIEKFKAEAASSTSNFSISTFCHKGEMIYRFSNDNTSGITDINIQCDTVYNCCGILCDCVPPPYSKSPKPDLLWKK